MEQPPIDNSSNIPTPEQPPVDPIKNIEIEKLKSSILNTDINPQPTTPPPAAPSKNILNILSNKKTILILVIILLLLITGGISYYYFVYNFGTLNVTFNEIPDTIEINGKSYSPSEKLNIKLKPGNYSVSAAKNNYFPTKSSFSITTNTAQDISISFNPFPSPTEIIEYPSKFPYLNPQETEISYLSNHDTGFYNFILSSHIKGVISSNNFNHINDVIWAPTAKTACIIQSTNNSELYYKQTENILYQPDRPKDSIIYHFYDFSKYNLVTQTKLTYPESIKHPSWHPTKEEIIFHYIDKQTNENSLAKAKPNLDNIERLYDLDNFQNAIVKYSPDTEKIAILETEPKQGEPNNIYIFYVIPRNFEKIPTKDIYTDFIWSPDSQSILGFKDSGLPSLIDIESTTSTDLNIKTDIKHVTFLNNEQKLVISLSAPQNNDQLVIFDLSTMQYTNLPVNFIQPLNKISDLIVDRQDTTLYFIGDEHLYSLPLSL